MQHPLELYDAQNRPLGRLKDKRAIERDGDWHRTAEIVVVNQRQELLLTLRHPAKRVLPNCWDVCIGGHVEPGETYEQAALREAEEEIGLRPVPGALRFLDVVAIDVVDNATALHDREHAAVFLWQLPTNVVAGPDKATNGGGNVVNTNKNAPERSGQPGDASPGEASPGADVVALTLQPDEVADARWEPLANVVADLAADVPRRTYTPPRPTYRHMLLLAAAALRT